MKVVASLSSQTVTNAKPAGKYTVELIGPHTQSQDFSALPAVVEFLDVPFGMGYQVKATVYDVDAAQIGEAVFSAPFNVEGVMITVFGAIAVQVAQG